MSRKFYIPSQNKLVVEPGTTGTAVLELTESFRPRQVIIPKDIASRFIVDNIFIDRFGQKKNDSQMMSPGGLPAAVFAEDAVTETYDFDSTRPCDKFCLSVTNRSTEPSPFMFCLSGDIEPVDPSLQFRHLPLGFGGWLVQPRGRIHVYTQPIKPFKGQRLVVPSQIADNFSISQIRVGKHDQLTTSAPASLFTEQTPRVGAQGLGLDTVSPSLFLEIVADNISQTVCHFTCAFLGTFVN
jgi:hypothetical protein